MSKTTESTKTKKRARRMRILVATLVICAGVAVTLIYLDYYINQAGNEPASAPVASQPVQPEVAGANSPEEAPAPAVDEKPVAQPGTDQQPAAQGPQAATVDSAAEKARNAEIEKLKSEIESLRRDLEHARGQGVAMEKELLRRNKSIQQFKAEVRKLGEQLQKSGQELGIFKNEATKKEQELTRKLTDAKDEIVKLKATLDDRSARLSELKERFNLRERQYQTEVASLQKSVQEANARNKDLFLTLEQWKKRARSLEDLLNAEKEERARQHLDKAREEIAKLDGRWNDEAQTHFENALQQFYFAGKVDPKNGETYRQMALELVDDQIARLRERRGRKAEDDKRMQVLQALRAQIQTSRTSS